MAHQDGRSVQQIKAETERTRATLTNTVEQLRASVSETADEVRQRISPTAIRADISSYFKSRGEQLVDDMSAMARDNPMQAVAIGAAVGYPLLKIARAIPLPVLMIGAGLFLTSTKRGQTLVHDARNYASDMTDEAVHQAQSFGNQVSRSVRDVADQSAEVAGRARDAVMGQVGRLGDTLSTATSAAETWAAENAIATAGSGIKSDTSASGSAYPSSLGSQTNNLRDQASRTLRDATGTIRQTASNASSSVSDAATSATNAAMEAARSAGESTMRVARQASRTMGDTVQQNPLLFAGLGLVFGALIASSLPRTDLEDELVGATSDGLKARAQDAAAEQFESAKSAATGAFDSVVESAKREGLSPEGLEASAQDIAQRMRHVAEAGLSTAFKNNSDNNEGGGRNHG